VIHLIIDITNYWVWRQQYKYCYTQANVGDVIAFIIFWYYWECL